jgi:glycerophosphoryl diester phosphodiesterase
VSAADPTSFFSGTPPRPFGHRGASGTHPENTLSSFAAAAERGSRGFELDVHRSADGEIVVFHDDTLERTTDGRGRVRDSTLEELRRLDAGHGFTPDGGRTHPFRGRGITIPTLIEVCEAFPRMPLIVEIKQVHPPLEEDLAQVLHQTGANDRALVFSLQQEGVDRYRALGTGRPTGFGPDDVAEFLRRLGSGVWDAYTPPGAAFAVPVRWNGVQVVSRPFVEAAHRIGCEVFVWTVNDPAEMVRLLDIDVDGLITDFPERLDRVLVERAAGD